jgi:hemerythrin
MGSASTNKFNLSLGETIMSTIKWDKKYEIGNVEIDSEHKIFVRIIQKIVRAAEMKKDHTYVERLIYELLKYADFHFYSEETVMMEMNYPDITNHQKEHEKLILKLREMVSVVEFKDYSRPMNDLIKLLTDWFATHTITVDKKLADYIADF